VYSVALSPETVIQHYLLGAGPVNIAPTAAFTPSVTDLALSVDASSSSDSDGTISSYDWTFGDGATGSGVTASHTYAVAGTYSVTLTVTDNGGATATTSTDVTVVAPPANVAPTAAFTSSSSGLTAALDGSASSDSDGSVVSYAWDFGDTSSGSGSTVSHAYAVAGTYPVTLTVTDNGGATGSVSHVVTVSDPGGVVALAQDAFFRTVSGGWGSAVLGERFGRCDVVHAGVDVVVVVG